MMQTAIVLSVIIAGLSLIWKQMIDPGEYIGEENKKHVFEKGGMIAFVGRKIFHHKLADPLGLCPLCSSFWASLIVVVCYAVLSAMGLLPALLTIAMTRILVKISM